MLFDLRKTVLSVAALALILATGCFRTASTPDSAAGNPLPTYTEGGTLTLQLNGLPVSVQITNAIFANTDEGYPDFIELSGPQTYIIAQVDNKIHDGPDGLSDFKPILNQPLPIT
ncbi:MAG: hypothetical protein RBU21_09930, partial [FCB group bacterium]|nr:hypothetical protein [FCB group bacterium]